MDVTKGLRALFPIAAGQFSRRRDHKSPGNRLVCGSHFRCIHRQRPLSRLYQGDPKSVCGTPEAAGHDPAGRADGRVLQAVGGGDRRPVPDPDQPLPPRLRDIRPEARPDLEAGRVI